MKKQGIALLLTPLLAVALGAAEIVLDGAKSPEEQSWTQIGTVPVVSASAGGIAVLRFQDDSPDSSTGLTLPLSMRQREELANGFELEFRARIGLRNQANGIELRICDRRIMVQLWSDGNRQSFGVYDGIRKKAVSAVAPDGDRFHTWGLRFSPAAGIALLLDGKVVAEQIGASELKSKGSLSLGGVTAASKARVGLLEVEKLVLRPL